MVSLNSGETVHSFYQFDPINTVEFEEKKRFGTNFPTRKVLAQYRKNVEVNLHPIELLIKTYDVAIASLNKQDGDAAMKAVNELILALNFQDSTPQSVREVASGFLRIYKFCRQCIIRRKYEEASKMLQDLRDTWNESFQKHRRENILTPDED